tara:strand:- start:84 stop:809 length:726 start_codon:yes stop_codon:yes gene_type:complete
MEKTWIKPISLLLLVSMSFWLPANALAQNQGITETLHGEGAMAIAILDLEGRGISELEAQTLTDRMRSELVNTGAVTIVERSQMQEILEEQGFQQTGCTSDECAVEVGKLLGVQNMVTGSIGKIGSSYTLDVRMFVVETGAILKTVNRTYRGEVDGLIMEIERLAWDIVDLTPPAGRFPDDAVPVAAAPAAPVAEKKKSSKLIWIGLGVVAVGAGAAVALGGGGEKAGPTIGNPPDFPTVP